MLILRLLVVSGLCWAFPLFHVAGEVMKEKESGVSPASAALRKSSGTNNCSSLDKA